MVKYFRDTRKIFHQCIMSSFWVVDYAGMIVLAAQGAQPRQLALDELKVPARQSHPNELVRVETAAPDERAAGSRA
jgi:hypothetical protein